MPACPERRPRLRTGLGLVLALAGSQAAAWENNHIHMLIGERPIGMAGAYTGVSDDPSGLFYNPAGIVYGHAPNLSASVNSWQQTNTTYQDAFGGGDWERQSSDLLPNFFGTTQPLGPLTVGFSYAVTRAVNEDQSQYFTGVPTGDGVIDFTINVDNQDTVNKIGPSAALELADGLSAGVTLYGHSRDRKTIINQVARYRNGDAVWENSYVTRSELGVEPVLGLMWEAAERISVGLTARTTEVLTSETESQPTCLSEGDFDGGICQPDSLTHQPPQTTSPRQTYPWEARLGVAWFASRDLLLATDLSLYTESGADKEATWNAAVGTEYYWSSSWALRAGFYTNHSFSPELVEGRANQPERIDYYGGTFGISRYSRNSSVSVGLTHAVGTGEAQIVAGDTGIQDVEASATTLFLGTSYAY